MKQKWLLPDKSTLNTHIHRKSLWSSCLCIHIELYFFFSLWKFVMFNLHKYRSIKKVKELMFKSFVCSYYNKNANMSDFRIHTIATPPPSSRLLIELHIYIISTKNTVFRCFRISFCCGLFVPAVYLHGTGLMKFKFSLNSWILHTPSVQL